MALSFPIGDSACVIKYPITTDIVGYNKVSTRENSVEDILLITRSHQQKYKNDFIQ